MSAHETFFDGAGFPALVEIFFGSEATFQGAGGPVSCNVVLDKGVVLEPVAYPSHTVTHGVTIDALVDEVGEVAQGNTFTVESVVYTCVEEIGNNGKVTKWVVNNG